MSYQELPVQMHPKYQEFLAFMTECPHRKTPSTMETAFWAWLKTKQEQSKDIIDMANFSVDCSVQIQALKPRFWQVTATAKTQDPSTGEVQEKHFKFNPDDRFMLSELAPIINNHIHEGDDFLPDCISVMVCARVMTEGGL